MEPKITRSAWPVLSRLMKTLLCWNRPNFPRCTFCLPAAATIIVAAATSTGFSPFLFG